MIETSYVLFHIKTKGDFNLFQSASSLEKWILGYRNGRHKNSHTSQRMIYFVKKNDFSSMYPYATWYNKTNIYLPVWMKSISCKINLSIVITEVKWILILKLGQKCEMSLVWLSHSYNVPIYIYPFRDLKCHHWLFLH